MARLWIPFGFFMVGFGLFLTAFGIYTWFLPIPRLNQLEVISGRVQAIKPSGNTFDILLDGSEEPFTTFYCRSQHPEMVAKTGDVVRLWVEKRDEPKAGIWQMAAEGEEVCSYSGAVRLQQENKLSGLIVGVLSIPVTLVLFVFFFLPSRLRKLLNG